MLVKICGITRSQDAELAARYGADFIGMVLAQASPRRAKPEDVRAVLKLRLSPPVVLVFGYDDATYIKESFAALANTKTFIQLMADHPQISSLLGLAPPERVIPSISAAEKVSQQSLARWKDFPLVLFDSHRSGDKKKAGGTGVRFDPQNIAGITRPFLYAGGLSPDNVAAVVRDIRPHGVDCASGVEIAPGIKDPEKVRRFIANARGVA
ncbi:MAG: phosphoribosylanthranilate isomerase [Turneriella sp.]|nr:phosphoribosylanthranilate isomerase [Turneriella sp.]